MFVSPTLPLVGKWTAAEVEQLHNAVARFGADISQVRNRSFLHYFCPGALFFSPASNTVTDVQISTTLRTRSANQIREKLKKEESRLDEQASIARDAKRVRLTVGCTSSVAPDL